MNHQTIHWRLHLNTSPEQVYAMLNSDNGRARFWAESAVEKEEAVHFHFPNGAIWQGNILERIPNQLFKLEYYGGSTITFELMPDGCGGTDLALSDDDVLPEHQIEVTAGWVSVLLALKAAVDFGIDLRNHDSERHWDQRYVDN